MLLQEFGNYGHGYINLKGMSKKKTVLKTMRLSTEVIEAVEKLAKKENRNFTNMVETILMQAIDNKNKEEKWKKWTLP